MIKFLKNSNLDQAKFVQKIQITIQKIIPLPQIKYFLYKI